MHRLTVSLSREEVGRLLDVPPAVVDGLIDSGRILCQFRKGEPRVPLEELEAFLRESLVRLYRAEAAADSVVMVAAPPQVAERPIADAPIAEEPPPLPDEPAEEPEEEPEEIEDPPEAEAEPPDMRLAQRFAPMRQIDGIFGDTKFTIVQMSRTGLRIRHSDPLVPGEEAKVSFAIVASARSFVMRARVVWTSLASSGGKTCSISGLRVIEHADRLGRAIDLLAQSHNLQPERRVMERRAGSTPIVPLEGVSDDEVAIVVGALQRFASDPVEANRWYSRARFALSDESVRKLAPPRPRDREEVLGIWEYLEHQVEIPKIHGIVTWARKAKAAG
jgi:hypothetical protein